MRLERSESEPYSVRSSWYSVSIRFSESAIMSLKTAVCSSVRPTAICLMMPLSSRMSEYVIESAMDLDASGAMDLAASSLPSDMLRKPTAISAGMLLRMAFCCSVNWSVPSSRAYLKMMPSSFVNSSSMILASPVRLIDLLILGLMQSILSLSQEYIFPSASSVPEALRVEPSIMSRMVMRPPGYGFVGKTSGFTPSFGFSSTTVPEMDIKVSRIVVSLGPRPNQALTSRFVMAFQRMFPRCSSAYFCGLEL